MPKINTREALPCWTGLLLLLILPFLISCDKAREPLRVGTNIWIGYEPLYLAQARGFYDGQPIRLVSMRNATEVQHALRAGVLEAAALTLDEVFSVIQDGIDLRIILVMDTSHGADVLLARPEVENLAALKGKRIGVESTAVGAILLQGALEAGGLSASDIRLVPLAVDQHAAAYRNQEVDAVVTFDPVRRQLLDHGAKVLFDSSHIPNRIVDVLVTTPEIAARREADLRLLVAGYFEALEHLRAAPRAAAETMTARQGISADEIVAAYRGLRIAGIAENRRLLAAGSPALAAPARRLVDLLLQQRLLQDPINVENLFDDRFLPAP